MKKTRIHFLCLAVILLLAAACSKSGNDDSKSLLHTIPADASSVVILNIDRAAESLGCKTDGTTLDVAPDIKKAVAESQAISKKNKQIFDDICQGKTGVSLTSLAFFSASRSYITGLLNDPEKFVDYMQESLKNPNDSTQSRSMVVEENGATIINSTIVVIGNQFWTCTEGTPDTDQLKYYQGLKDNQSYIESETAPLLLESDKVLTYVADVSKTLARMPESTYTRMGASLMFKDIAYMAGTAHFEKKNFISSSKVLNSKMQPAELLLPTEKIDVDVVKSLNRNGDVFIAAGISDKLSKKISESIATLLGASGNSVATAIQQIDGTTAICFDLTGESALAKISTTGKDFASLSNLLQIIPGVSVTRDADMLTLKYDESGVANAALTADEAAEKLKGAWIGAVSSDVPAKGMNTVMRLVPENKSLVLDIDVEGGLEALMTAILK